MASGGRPRRRNRSDLLLQLAGPSKFRQFNNFATHSQMAQLLNSLRLVHLNLSVAHFRHTENLNTRSSCRVLSW